MQITAKKFIQFDPIPQLRLKFKFNVAAFRLRTDAADKTRPTGRRGTSRLFPDAMSHIFSQLDQLLLGSIPTIVIFLLLLFFLRAVLFAPLRRTLAERRRRTEDRMTAARHLLEQATAAASLHEAALREEQLAGYQRLQELRQQALRQRGQQLETARQEAMRHLAAAAAELAEETKAARHSLQNSAQQNAEQILAALLPRANGAPA